MNRSYKNISKKIKTVGMFNFIMWIQKITNQKLITFEQCAYSRVNKKFLEMKIREKKEGVICKGSICSEFSWLRNSKQFASSFPLLVDVLENSKSLQLWFFSLDWNFGKYSLQKMSNYDDSQVDYNEWVSNYDFTKWKTNK